MRHREDAISAGIRAQADPGARSRSSARRAWAALCIGLAVAITVWGFGYKLSRYNPRRDPAWRVSLVKLWDNHQDPAEDSALAVSDHRDLQPMLELALLHLFQPSVPICQELCPRDEDKRNPSVFHPRCLSDLLHPA